MKALYVFQRIFHYLALWLFIAAGVLGAFGLYYVGYGLALSADMKAVGALVYYAGFLALILVVVAIVALAAAHIFRMCVKLVAKKRARKEECCECCCECKCEKPASDLDAQVEEVMKWKNLYVEGIITEREFIDKRNEILRLSK